MKQVHNLPDKDFKTLAIEMQTEHGKRIGEHRENFDKKLENIKKNQSELKNTITEMKNTLEGINSRLGGIEECKSVLEDRITEITQSEQQKSKTNIKIRTVYGTARATSSVLTFTL